MGEGGGRVLQVVHSGSEGEEGGGSEQQGGGPFAASWRSRDGGVLGLGLGLGRARARDRSVGRVRGERK